MATPVARWARAPTTRLSSSISASPRSMSLRRRRRSGRRLSLALRLVRALRALWRSGFPLRRRRGADGRACRAAHGESRCCRCSSKASPPRSTTIGRSCRAPGRSAQAAADLARLIDQNAFSLSSDPTRPVLAPERETECPRSICRRSTLCSRGSRKVHRTTIDVRRRRAERNAPQCGDAQVTQFPAARDGAGADQRTRASRAQLVPPPDLRAGIADRLRRQDASGRARSDRAHRWDEANEYARLTAQLLKAYCDRLDQATALLQPAASRPSDADATSISP